MTRVQLRGRSLLKEADLTKDEFTFLVDFAQKLREDRRSGTETMQLTGRDIVLIFEKASTRTRSAFEIAAHDQGAHVTYFGPGESHMGSTESIKDTARVLGRMFDGIEYRGFGQERVETLSRYAGVPVWNGLTDQWHPTQMLADVLTMRDHSTKPIEEVSFCYLGDTRNNTARSLLVTGALLGADVRLAGPESMMPAPDAAELAALFAASSGARLTLTADHHEAVAGADFIYTDVWLSMGEPDDKWGERITQLLPYQVNAALMKATGNPDVKFMHCLPALHDRQTEVGQTMYERFGLPALEVTDEVFESSASVVFDQAANRMHTIKATMVATMAG